MSELDPLELRRPGAGAQRTVTFRFEGRTLPGVEGEPIAAALHAQGVRVLSRSMKHRRPRGLHCVAGACPNCSMRVNGLPGVTTCTAPLSAGDVVERERGVPNADRDLLAVMDRFSRFAPVGFQYRRFRRSPRLFARWERVLARLAGSGGVPDEGAARALVEQASWSADGVDVAVVGGGAAGMSAALAAARAGAQVMLVERDAVLGGRGRTGGSAEGRARVEELARLVTADPSIRVATGSTAFGWYAEGLLAVALPAGMLELRAGGVVLASGAHDRPLAFADNDRPGVMLAGGVERLLAAHSVRPGRRVVVATGEDAGYDLAATLLEDGVEVAAIADRRRAPGDAAAAAADRLRERGVELMTGTTVARALGRTTVTGVRLQRGGSAADVRCDTLAIANGRRPARELLLQRAAAGGIEMRVPDAVARSGGDPSRAAAEGWWLAGAVAGASTLEAAQAAGALAGRAAAEARS